MSSNTLVAICVGCLFALAFVTIIVGYLERVRILRRYDRKIVVVPPEPDPPEEQVTEQRQWPSA